jgi:hypothetical protein
MVNYHGELVEGEDYTEEGQGKTDDDGYFPKLSIWAKRLKVRGLAYWFLGSLDFKIMGIGKMTMARLVMILRIPVVMRLA